jgi:septal ring factor EnvC (AmiA/AmiB activator)
MSQQPELQLVSQMLAEEVAERAEEQAEMAALEAKYEACESREKALAIELATCKAEESAAKRELAECQKAEERGRCTYLIRKMTEEEQKENAPPKYKLVVTETDGNGGIRSVSVVPEKS